MKYVVVVPVWGDAFIDTFIDISLPSLMWHGNLPFLAKNAEVILGIVAPVNYEEKLAKLSSALEGENIKLDIMAQELVRKDEFKTSYERMSGYYSFALRKHKYIEKGGYILLTPDSIYGNHTIGNIHKHASNGVKAIMVPAPRASKESLLKSSFIKNFVKTVPIENRHLVRYMMKSMHDIALSQCINIKSNMVNLGPIHAYWKVGELSLVARCFVMHPLYLNPDYPIHDIQLTLDYNLVQASVKDLNSVYVAQNSDEFFCCDMAPESYKHFDIRRSPKVFRELIVSILTIRWLKLGWATYFHCWLGTHICRFIGEDINQEEWRKQEKASTRFINKIFSNIKFNNVFDFNESVKPIEYRYTHFASTFFLFRVLKKIFGRR